MPVKESLGTDPDQLERDVAEAVKRTKALMQDFKEDFGLAAELPDDAEIEKSIRQKLTGK